MCFSVSLSSSLSIGCLFLGHYWFNCSLLEADEWGVHAESMLISWNIHFWEAIVRWCLDDIFIVVIFFHLSRILCFWLPPRVSFFGQYFFFFFSPMPFFGYYYYYFSNLLFFLLALLGNFFLSHHTRSQVFFWLLCTPPLLTRPSCYKTYLVFGIRN